MELSVRVEIHQSASAHLDFMVLCASSVIVPPIPVEMVELASPTRIAIVASVCLRTKETFAKGSRMVAGRGTCF